MKFGYLFEHIGCIVNWWRFCILFFFKQKDDENEKGRGSCCREWATRSSGIVPQRFPVLLALVKSAHRLHFLSTILYRCRNLLACVCNTVVVLVSICLQALVLVAMDQVTQWAAIDGPSWPTMITLWCHSSFWRHRRRSSRALVLGLLTFHYN